MQRNLLSFLVLAMVLTLAPAAMADHCERCRPISQSCGLLLNNGWQDCFWDASGCHLADPCGDHTRAAAEPLASEFMVASVERLDEPQTAASETLVASATTPAPANR